MPRFLISVLVLLVTLQAVVAWILPGALPALRSPSSRAGVTSVFMGRKPATVGKGPAGRGPKVRERTKGTGVGAVIKVKRVTGVDVCQKMINNKLDKVTKDNFAEELLNDKVKTFMTEEAGSTMYPTLMKKIKMKAAKLGVSVPDRWAYEAKANKYQRAKLAAKNAAPAEEEAATA